MNWDFPVEPQPGLNGATMQWPRGKVLGGSSAINGLYLTRPGEIETNAWHTLLGDIDGADNWTWESQYAAMKKAETFTPPSAAIAREGGITYDASSRGTSGPLQVTYPGFTDILNGDWSPANTAAGNPATNDAYGGENWGAFICTSSIDPATWTRSYSKSAYLDTINPPRDNYQVLTNALVTKINFDTSSTPLKAISVEYSPDGGTTKKTVKVTKDVVVSGGSIGSPAILQHSGIGPKDVLSKAGVKMLYELPGVGQHLMDHASTQMEWDTSIPTVGDQADTLDSPEFLSFVNDAVAFPGSDILFGSSADAQKNSILSNYQQYAPSDSKVNAGYEAVVKAQANTIWPSKTGQVELLMALTQTNSSVALQVTLQHPYSQGSVNIQSSDPTDYPSINPNYMQNPADIEIMTAGLKFMREVGNSGALGTALSEISPGTDTQTDAEWEKFIRGNLYTEFHPSSTCSMLPEDMGGVVDGNLLVYGTANVRVADASVPPLEPSSHLMGGTYGLAEKASEIIIEQWQTNAKQQNNNNDDGSVEASSKARVRGGGRGRGGAGGGAENSSPSLAASLAPIISAVVAVVACITFG